MVATVTAKDADVGENSRLSYSIDAGDETGLFDIADDSGVITWSALTNDSLTVCYWSLSIRVTDHGKVKQLWTRTSLVIAIDDCAVDNIVHAASRQSAADLGRLLITDWHLFVVAVAVAVCVVVVGTLLTVVVALRHCRRRPRRKRTATTTSGGDELARNEDGEGEIMLKLMPSPTQSSDVSSESVASSSCTDHVLLVVDQLSTHQHVDDTLIRALQQQAHRRIHGTLQVLTKSFFLQYHNSSGRH